eukprot:3885195-Prymnesium_polylepis.1
MATNDSCPRKSMRQVGLRPFLWAMIDATPEDALSPANAAVCVCRVEPAAAWHRGRRALRCPHECAS